nr:unnamed protein product [Digitaria exilis]
MADASSSSGGGAGDGPHPSSSPATATRPSPASLDGGLLLRLLQSPPHGQPRAETPVPGPGAHHFFLDPAVATVGPLFAAPPQMQGGVFAWSSTSALQSQQNQLRFLDPRFAPGETYAALGGDGMGFGSGDAVRVERPRPGAPPPGFGKPSHPSAALHDASNTFGGAPSREQNHHRPNGFSTTSNKEPQTVPPFAVGGRAFGRMPDGERSAMPIRGGCGVAVGAMYKEQQQQDHILSQTPPDMNTNISFGRMPLGEQHTLPINGGMAFHGDHYIHPIEGSRMQIDQGQQEHWLVNTPQREQTWQGLKEEKGYALRKLANTNAHDTFGKAPVKELRHVTLPAGSSFTVGPLIDQVNGLEDGKVVAEAWNFGVPYQKGNVSFAEQDEDGDDGREEGTIIEQLTESLVIDGNGETKGVLLKKTIPRSKEV